MTKFALFVAATAALVVVASATADNADKKEVGQCKDLGGRGSRQDEQKS